MFRWKNYVYEVYRARSFSAAAQNLYISQPSLSARIIAVERELGMPIFDRSTTPIRLTEFGEAYIEAVEEVRRIEERVENYLNDLSELRSGHIAIGASNVFAAYVLPPVITEYKRRFPGVEVRLVEGNTSMLEQMLSDGDLDMVLDNNHYDGELYDRGRYSEERILLALPKQHPVCRSVERYRIGEEELRCGDYLREDFRTVPLSAFSEVPFVMLTHGNDTRLRSDRLCREAGFTPTVVLELNQQATAYMVASTSIGATFVSDTVARRLPSHDTLAYFKLSGEAAERTVYFYYKKRKYKTRAMEEMIGLISEPGV